MGFHNEGWQARDAGAERDVVSAENQQTKPCVQGRGKTWRTDEGSAEKEVGIAGRRDGRSTLARRA